ncbi:hypothetical protein AKG11_12055 [Shinella sp. SUS2]|uniref:hypothetical protein n=1 Tax=unclassified Shinella TaxID=2643062 RepID=UPI00067F97DF|nr:MULTISPECIES: hypothetical protein [unclassified Shinella]KNY16430.1 hypothetical protein AKG11_12055 [Shinella sp. SUS2]KOC77026.1 hypothetical protein AKG10_04100 [Shinella sp. GWS1]
MYQTLGAFYASEDQFVKRIALETLSKLLDPSHIITLIEEEVIETANRALIGPSLKVFKALSVKHRPAVIKSAVKMLTGDLAAEGAAFLVEIGIDKKTLRYLIELISRNASSIVRRRFVAALADQEGPVTAALAREPLTRDIYDFGTHFDRHEIAALANFATVRRRIFTQRMASRSLSHYPELEADAAIRDAFIGMDKEQTENEIERSLLDFSTRYSLGWSFANHGSVPMRET